ncbi:MAG: hypothetical protein RMM98_14320, partial [Acidobacteriota bacterium]|nr:hypothetical protein [Acidobacteriota bacterium]
MTGLSIKGDRRAASSADTVQAGRTRLSAGATLSHLLRAWVYVWASPATLIGVLIALLVRLRGGSVRLVRGVIEVHGSFLPKLLSSRLPWLGSSMAITLGHVVLSRDADCLEYTRRHERVHVRQYERWGPFFLPAYFLSSLAALLRGRHPYHDNWFERKAFE